MNAIGIDTVLSSFHLVTLFCYVCKLIRTELRQRDSNWENEEIEINMRTPLWYLLLLRQNQIGYINQTDFLSFSYIIHYELFLLSMHFGRIKLIFDYNHNVVHGCIIEYITIRPNVMSCHTAIDLFHFVL